MQHGSLTATIRSRAYQRFCAHDLKGGGYEAQAAVSRFASDNFPFVTDHGKDGIEVVGRLFELLTETYRQNTELGTLATVK